MPVLSDFNSFLNDSIAFNRNISRTTSKKSQLRFDHANPDDYYYMTRNLLYPIYEEILSCTANFDAHKTRVLMLKMIFIWLKTGISELLRFCRMPLKVMSLEFHNIVLRHGGAVH